MVNRVMGKIGIYNKGKVNGGKVLTFSFVERSDYDALKSYFILRHISIGLFCIDLIRYKITLV